jgi:hypothetical protein
VPPPAPGWPSSPPPPQLAWTAGAPGGPQPAYAGWNPGAGAAAGWNPYGYAGAPPRSGGLRPRGVGELLDGAFTLYRRNFLLLVAIAAVLQIPFALLQLLAFQLADVGGRLSSLQTINRSLLNQGNIIDPTQHEVLSSDLGAIVAYYAIGFLVQFLIVYPLSLAATTSAVSARYLDQPATVGSSYRAALSRWRPLIAMVLWLVLMVGGGLTAALLLAVFSGSGILAVVAVLAALVVYVVVLVRTTVGSQAIVLEKRSGWQGIQRSWALTDRSFWRISGILFLLAIIQTVVGYVIILPLGAVLGPANLGTQQLISQAAQAVTAVFVAPISLVTLTLLYYDLRIRREGFDIEMLAASL